MTIAALAAPTRPPIPTTSGAMMPTYLVSVRETRTYEIDASSEDHAREIIDRDEPDLPVGALRSVQREEVSVRSSGGGTSDQHSETDGDWPPFEGQPRPDMPTPRAL